MEERAAKQVLEKEVNNLLLQLHAVQLQLHSNAGMPLDSENIKNKLVSRMLASLICSCLYNELKGWFYFEPLHTMDIFGTVCGTAPVAVVWRGPSIEVGTGVVA